jgi:hypothetical protein
MTFSPLLAVLFSTPLAALAVAGGAAAVPVIIHLLNRKRFVIVPWAAMRFLLAARRKNVRRLRLEQWLLLAIRVLVGLLIVGAMVAVHKWAEPLWQGLPGGQAKAAPQGRTHRVIIIDGSFGMAARAEDDGTRFELARAQAKALLDHAAPGDGFSVVFLSSPALLVVPGPADDRRKVADAIDELTLPHGSADVSGGLRLVADLVNRPLGKYTRREVAFVTDLKKSSWPLPAAADDAPEAKSPAAAPAAATSGIADAWRTIARGANLVFVDVARQNSDNLAVTSLTLNDPLPLVNMSTSASAVLQNFGRQERKEVPVKLRVAPAPRPGERLTFTDAGEKLVNVAAGATVTVTFPLERETRFREAGEYVLQVTAGEDVLRLDDSRALVVSVRETIPVLVVNNGKAAADPLDAPGAWVRLALRPAPAKAKLPNCPAVPTMADPTVFADRFRADLTKYDCVFLCDLPSINGDEAARLEAHLRRGGSVVISLGPNAARNAAKYNEVLFNDGKGILPGRILGERRAEGESYFALVAGEEAFKHPPLSAYRDDKERAALTLPQFHAYVRLDAPANGPARRVLSFAPMTAPGKADAAGPAAGALDPAVVDYPRHRGRVIVYTSTFNPERAGRGQVWSGWAPHPTFLPFLQETLRYAVAGGGRHNLLAGEVPEEYLPATSAGLKARLSRWDGDADAELETADVVSRDDSAVVAFAPAALSGVYRLSVGQGSDALFAVNVPTTAPGGGAESDLRRLTLPDLQAPAPDADVQLVTDAGDVQPRSAPANAGETKVDGPDDPRGPRVARFLLLVLLALLLAEVFFAWRYGSARASSTELTPPAKRRLLARLLWFVPAAACLLVVVAVAHAGLTGEFLGFLPSAWRQPLEHSLGVPPAAPGEGTRWRLEAMAYVTGVGRTDRWIVTGAALLGAAYVGFVYRRERIGGARRRSFFGNPLVALASLRVGLVLLTLLVLLPQLQLAFEREGWPDVVLIFDDSKSMATVENFHDPVLREKAAELRLAWAELAAPRIARAESRAEEIRAALRSSPSAADAGKLRDELATLEKKIKDLRTPHRLNLIKALLASGSQDWLQTFLRERQMRVHIYRASAQASQVVELNDPAQCARAMEEIIDLVPEGEASRLGDSVAAVLKTFKGGSLSAIVTFTDGQTTAGEEPHQAARLAARAGVPLYFVGVGDNQPPPDLAVGDLKAERVVNVKDRLIFEFRLSAQGPGMPEKVPVNLYEIVNGKPVRRNDPKEPAEYPVNRTVRLAVTPDTPGAKEYVIEVPAQPGEANLRNNRIEHEVRVDVAQRVRVLLIEGAPRYEYRYLKTLLERETEKVRGNKSIELSVYVPGATPDVVRQDKSMILDLPGWEVLKTYHVIILGDVDPKLFPRGPEQVKLLADFVREREGGGGLLMIAGEHFAPAAYAGTELADVLPVTAEGVNPPPAPRADDPPLTEGYRPRLTTAGQNHPIFRFAADDADNAAVWNGLEEMLWSARGYRRKLSAEVLAVHPKRAVEPGPGGSDRDEPHPLVLQQFVGAGRVMFFGFDETWRWRLRQGEPHFNQFWVQVVRSLARTRVGRVEVRVERKTYRRDEPIRVTVRFPDDAPPPPADQEVRVDVERRPPNAPDAEPEVQTIPLTRKEGTRTFEALLTRTPEGEYHFVLAAPRVADKQPKAEATVLPPRGELDDTRLNEAELQRAAADSRGAYYPLDRAERLIDDLPSGPRVALDQPCKPLRLWNNPLMFALVFSLLVAEWVLRKRARLL